MAWRHSYQAALKKYLLEVEGAMVGGDKTVVVIDETAFGSQKGIRKAPGAVNHGKPPGRRSNQKHMRKKLPARTLWKAGVKSVMK